MSGLAPFILCHAFDLGSSECIEAVDDERLRAVELYIRLGVVAELAGARIHFGVAVG
ncbi:hypothetical protein ACFOHK_16185 [Falsigemmobacter intermedius]|uniref:hypothetical protein n=1 Tax=Falsigemmobacter intermedius TaxID=1553448 RepID=UPI0013E35165